GAGGAEPRGDRGPLRARRARQPGARRARDREGRAQAQAPHPDRRRRARAIRAAAAVAGRLPAHARGRREAPEGHDLRRQPAAAGARLRAVPGSRGDCRARTARAGLLACALLAGAGAASAQPPEAGAQKIFAALHLELELEDIAAEAHASVAEPLRGMPPGDALLLRSAIAGCFDPGALAAL